MSRIYTPFWLLCLLTVAFGMASRYLLQIDTLVYTTLSESLTAEQVTAYLDLQEMAMGRLRVCTGLFGT